jgi:hypothetical protein
LPVTRSTAMIAYSSGPADINCVIATKVDYLRWAQRRMI